MKKHITPIPEGHEIDEANSTFQEIIFKKIKPKYPTEYTEVKGWYISCSEIQGDTNKYLENFKTKEECERFYAYKQLIELRDEYNKIDGCVEFVVGVETHIIRVNNNEIEADRCCRIYNPLHFGKRSTRDLFMKNFKGLLEQAKGLY